MPVIAGQAGNAGIQTATIVIRSLALGEVAPRDTMAVLLRASSTGVLLPMALSRLGKDPATIAGVFDTMLSDLMGNLIYLGLATLLLRWLV
jgi:magnesium transporter